MTGDYWHSDFRDVLTQLKMPTTLVPGENIKSHKYPPGDFELIVLAQARRDQFSSDDFDFLQQQFPQTPIISLLGSWCEGEMRSGTPVAGPIRIYWHQWQGRYDSFAKQINSNLLSTWHLPRTAIPVDRVVSRMAALAEERDAREHERNDIVVGVSAWTRDGFEMISDAVENFGFCCDWLEHDTLSGKPSRRPAVLCINADSLSENLQANLLDQRSRFPNVPIVVLLNFPRKFEVDSARELGVSEIVSKPFELIDLKFALERALKKRTHEALKQDIPNRPVAG
jgi:hypothetical protein